ncbi:MAG TPA: SDR family oxidoreductase [Thermoleophilaceae bacterium]|nr:SDR family oxidoreductase [Thermoleophilaceae bacterium]
MRTNSRRSRVSKVRYAVCDFIRLLLDLGLADRACIVTGASRGIGRAVSAMLKAEGANVLEASRASGHDVTDPQAGERLAAECLERHGRLDVLVNNAGTSRSVPLDRLTDDDWNEQWELHVMGPMRLMKACAPHMAEAGGGRVVNVCSSAGKRPSLTNAAYSVTKAAQLSLSRAFADAWASEGLLVNAVAPGAVASSLWTGEGGLADQVAEQKGIDRDQALASQAAKIPLGRLGTEDEIAAVIVFLCSERASNVTGAAWSVDGGAVPVIL